MGSGPRRVGRGRRPRTGRDGGPDWDRYGAHPNADCAPEGAGAAKREQDPLGSQGILLADQGRLRGLGAGRPCLAGGGPGRGEHVARCRADGVPRRSRGP